MSRPKSYARMTLREKYTLYLTDDKKNMGRGCVPCDSKTGKYTVFSGSDSGGEYYFFLGKSGSVRFNRKNAASTSMDYSSILKRTFQKWETINHKLEEV